MPSETPRNSKLRAALIGGIGFGILSALPYVGAVNQICCALFVGGGCLASCMYFRNAPGAVARSYGAGASVGLLAGVFGGLVSGLLLVLPPSFGLGLDDMRAAAVNQVAQLEGHGIAVSDALREAMGMHGATPTWIAVSMASSVALFCLAGTLGGMIGAAIMRRRDEGSA